MNNNNNKKSRIVFLKGWGVLNFLLKKEDLWFIYLKRCFYWRFGLVKEKKENYKINKPSGESRQKKDFMERFKMLLATNSAKNFVA